jgi:hypothetical protein
MTDESETKTATWIQILAFSVSVFIILPILWWCSIFALVWVVLSLPFDIPNPIFLADCLATGSEWACKQV